MSAKSKFDKFPDALPEKPEGWKQKMLMHMNFGSDGGAATFELFDSAGRKMPIGKQYDTRKGGLSGFTLDGIDGALTWKQLREAWPAWIASKKENT